MIGPKENAAKLPANRAERRKENRKGLRRKIKRARGVAIPRHLQPWATEANRNDES